MTRKKSIQKPDSAPCCENCGEITTGDGHVCQATAKPEGKSRKKGAKKLRKALHRLSKARKLLLKAEKKVSRAKEKLEALQA